MKKYEIKASGIHPVVWNVIQKELEDEKKALKKNELNEWEEANWRRKAEFTGNDVIIPSRWIRGCLIEACKRTRLVPHYATKRNETYTNYMKSCIVDKVKPVCKKKDLEYYGAYVNGNPNSAKKSKVWRVRPRLSKWYTTFEFIDVFGRMKKEELKEILEYGGMLVGIGDATALNFGRFEVVSIKEVSK